MKRIFLALFFALSAPAIFVQPALAQFGFGGVVFDPRNFAQNILTASRTLTQINNQVRQIQNEIRMLENQARNLERLPDSIAGQIRDRLLAVDELIRAAEGISYRVDEIEGEYERIYRESYGDNPPPQPVIVEEANAAWRQSRQGYMHSLQVQARVVENIRTDISDLQGKVGESQAAVGQLQALQAGNQIQALTAQQLMQIQELLVAQQRAEALEQSRILAERERGRARLRRFLGGDAYPDGGR